MNLLRASRLAALSAVVLLFPTLSPPSATAITIRDDVPEADYISLSADPKWDAAGAYTATSTLRHERRDTDPSGVGHYGGTLPERQR